MYIQGKSLIFDINWFITADRNLIFAFLHHYTTVGTMRDQGIIIGVVVVLVAVATFFWHKNQIEYTGPKFYLRRCDKRLKMIEVVVVLVFFLYFSRGATKGARKAHQRLG